jgi:hypothetical protein
MLLAAEPLTANPGEAVGVALLSFDTSKPLGAVAVMFAVKSAPNTRPRLTRRRCRGRWPTHPACLTY